MYDLRYKSTKWHNWQRITLSILLLCFDIVTKYHCLKNVRIQSFSGPYFPVFRLNTERHDVSLRIQSNCRTIRTKKTPNTDTFHAVFDLSQVQVKQNLVFSVIEMHAGCLKSCQTTKGLGSQEVKIYQKHHKTGWGHGLASSFLSKTNFFGNNIQKLQMSRYQVFLFLSCFA